jgi:hypothetical protein
MTHDGVVKWRIVDPPNRDGERVPPASEERAAFVPGPQCDAGALKPRIDGLGEATEQASLLTFKKSPAC